MPDEKNKIKDELSLKLYDENGNLKQEVNSQKRKLSLLQRLFKYLRGDKK